MRFQATDPDEDRWARLAYDAGVVLDSRHQHEGSTRLIDRRVTGGTQKKRELYGRADNERNRNPGHEKSSQSKAVLDAAATQTKNLARDNDGTERFPIALDDPEVNEELFEPPASDDYGNELFDHSSDAEEAGDDIFVEQAHEDDEEAAMTAPRSSVIRLPVKEVELDSHPAHSEPHNIFSASQIMHSTPRARSIPKDTIAPSASYANFPDEHEVLI
jgi:hypothetical protein